MTAFSTRDEALIAWGALRDVVERLPAADREVTNRLAGSLHAMRSALTAAILSAPGDAHGTRAHREVHGLPPLTPEEIS